MRWPFRLSGIPNKLTINRKILEIGILKEEEFKVFSIDRS